MKKQNKDLFYAEANQRQRFSIRKLSIGAASVLLSTAFYLGNTASVSHAETTVKANADNPETTQVEQKQPQITNDAISSETQPENVLDNSKSKTNNTTQSFNPQKVTTPSPEKAFLPSKVEKQKHTSIKLSDDSKNTVDSGSSISFVLQTNDFKEGDKFQVVFDETGNGLDASGTYSVEAGDNPSLVQTTTTRDDTHAIIDNNFINHGTFDQIITLQTSENFKPDLLQSDGTYDRTVHVLKNGKEVASTNFKQKVSHSTNLSWAGGLNNSETSLWTTNTPAAQVQKANILPNTDYNWKFNFTYNPNFNHGVTIDIPVPKDFVLNTESTKNENTEFFDSNTFNGTIVQNGNSVQLTLPELTKDQLKAAANSGNMDKDQKTIKFNLIGKFTTKRTKVDQTLTGGEITSKASFSSTDSSLSDSHKISPIIVNILGTDHTLDKLTEGEILFSNIDPDEKDKTKNPEVNVTPKAKTDSHALNKNVKLSNVSAYELNNVQSVINIPDGMKIGNFSSNNLSSPPANFQYQYIYSDDTSSSFYDYNNTASTPTDPTKTVKQIVFKFDKVNPYQPLFDISLNGVLADKYYSTQKEVKVGDHLQTTLSAQINNGQSNELRSCDQIVVDKVPKKPVVHNNDISANGNQESKKPGQTKAGQITISFNDLKDDKVNSSIYVVLPTNALLTTNPDLSELPSSVTWKIMQINGRNVLKFDFNNISRKDIIEKRINLDLSNTNILTKANLSSDYKVFVTLPEGESNHNNLNFDKNIDSPFFENSNNSFSIKQGDWNILGATGTYTITQAQGNQNSFYSSQGTSDDHGEPGMKFSNYIVDDDDQDLQNLTSVVSVPGTADGKSQFNFTLTDPVEVIDDKTNQKIDDANVTYYYTTQNFDPTTLNDNNFDQIFNSTDQPEDLSKVTGIAVKVNRVPKHSIYRIELKGKDGNLANDAGKTAYLASQTWSDILPVTGVKAGSNQSASISIVGNSTVHIKLHKADTDEYIDAGDIHLIDNNPNSQLKFADVLKTAIVDNLNLFSKYQNIQDINQANDDPAFRKAFLAKYPELKDYAINLLPTINNSKHGDYANGAPNDKTDWNQTAKYYYDGDQVIFELVKLQKVSRDIVINRNINYLSTLDDRPVKDPDKHPKVHEVTLDAIYDPLTNHYQLDIDKNNYGFASQFNLDGISLPTVTGYSPEDSTLGVIKYFDGNQLIFWFENHLTNFFNINSKHGYQLDVDQSQDSDFSLREPISEINSIPSSQLIINVNQTVYYSPSYANLIQIGLPDQENKIWISKSINGNKASNEINFGVNDDDLKIPGYDYKVYYLNDNFKANRTYHDGRPSYIYVTPNDILKGEPEEFSSLKDALEENPEYDNQADSTRENKNLGTVQSAGQNTQNFVVIYTPNNELKQDVYILSDNDPFKENDLLKQFAMPKSIAESNQLIQDILNKAKDPKQTNEKLQELAKSINSGKYIPLWKLSGKSGTFLFNSESSRLNEFDANSLLANLTNQIDQDGNPLPTIPYSDSNDISLQNYNMGASLYTRNGYYIQKVTLTSTDNLGKKHVITITNHLNKNLLQDEAPGSTGDDNLLKILNYLTNNQNSNEDLSTSQPDPGDQNNNVFYISIDGQPGITITQDPDGEINYANIPNSDRFTFDNTVYDGKVDTHPQTIEFHYEKLPIDAEQNTITIHYIDVTDVPEASQEDFDAAKDSSVELPKDTKYAYGSNGANGTELYFDKNGNLVDSDSDGTPITFSFTEDGQSYENKLDPTIIKNLAKENYYVVQRDKQTSGLQHFDLMATDSSNNQFDGNLLYLQIGNTTNPQNYYVFLKRGKKVNYKVILENPDGTTQKTLQDSTYLGIGDPNATIASAPVDYLDAKKGTLGDEYQSILDTWKNNPNYDIVLNSNDKYPNLKITDKLGKQIFNDNPELTIYLMPKYGNVTVHYIDVDTDARKNPDKKEFELKDGEEIADQRPVSDKQYGTEYQNTPWHYEDEGYELATTSLPDGATSGKVNNENNDIYVFLKHKHTPITDKTVNETIKYVDENDNALPKNIKDTTKRTITFSPNKGAYHDEVTGADHVTWTPDGDFTKSGDLIQFGTADTDAYGYELDKDTTKNDKSNPADVLTGENVSAVTVDPSKELKDITLTIHYKKKSSSIKINYVDVEGLAKDNYENGKTIADGKHDISRDGHTGDSVFENSTTPWNYANEGWVFVATTDPSSPIDSNLKIGDKPQQITVYLKHKHTPITDKTVNETINYVDQAGNKVKETTKRTITFSPNKGAYHDVITNTDYVTWSASGDLAKNSKDVQFDVDSTDVPGYDLDLNEGKTNPADLTQDHKNVHRVTVNKDSKDINITIHYNKQYKTHIHYIDVNDSKKTSGYTKEDGSPIAGHDVDHVGHINDPIFPNDETPWDYAEAGWILAEKPSTSVTKDMTFTKDTPKDIYIYLKHDTTKPFNKDKPGATPIHVTETIKYVDEDGKSVADKNGNTTAKSTKTITLTPQGYFDKVKGKNVVTGWTTKDGNEFPPFSLPEFDDYFAISASHKDQDNKDVDDFDNDKNQVKPVSYYASKVPATTTENQKVEVTVVLKKKHSALQKKKPMTVTETVHYVDENGKSVKSDDKVEMTLTPEGYHDNVTDEDVITGWTSSLNNSEFPTHPTHVDGYDIDMTKTKASDVSDNHSDVKAVKVTVGQNNTQPENIEITIHYKKSVTPSTPDNGGKTPNGDPNDPGKDGKTPPENPSPKDPNKDGKTPEPSPKNPDNGNHTPDHPTPGSEKQPGSKNPTPEKQNNGHNNEHFTHVASQQANDKVTANKAAASKQTLPQTGVKETATTVIGLALASVAAMFGLAADKKRKN